jgi:phosphohistidine phosphatase
VRVYLIRHADAVDAGPRISDDARWLSERGRDQCRRVGERLANHGVELDVVLSSPLTRAVQTAELIAGALGWRGVVQTAVALSPGVPARAASNELPGRGDSIALVGHEPSIAELAAYLCGRPAFPPFRRAQVALIDGGRPVWTLDPDRLHVDRLLVP